MKYQEGTPGPRCRRIGRQHKNTLEIAASPASSIHGKIERALNGANALITGAGSEQPTHFCIGVGRVIDKQLSSDATAMLCPTIAE
jgi:hypothetical protein